MNRKLLTFGFVPIDFGGKQKNGLATGLFSLHYFISLIDGRIPQYLAAIDIKKTYSVGQLNIIGWKYYSLLFFIFRHSFKIHIFLINAFKIRRIAPYLKIRHILFKLIFYNYAINMVKPQILHFHGIDDALISKFISYKAIRILRLHGINGYDNNVKNYDGYKFVEQYVTRNCNFDLVTFISNTNFYEWQKFYGDFNSEMKVILNGFNKTYFHNDENSDRNKQSVIKLLSVGKISNLKGQIRVVAALLKIANKKKYEYIIIGEDYGEGKSIKSLLKHHPEINVKILNYLQPRELLKYYLNANYFILPSSSEGFGLVFLESIACGTPVIIPKHLPLANEVGILNETNSILIEDESVDSIYKCLNSVEKFKFDREEVASTVKHLTWAEIGCKYTQTIIDLIK